MKVPNHVAIIPDGNRRWAKTHRLLPWQGHAEGVKRFWDVSDAAREMGVEYLTFWSGSYDNLAKRTETEIKVLFKLMEQQLSDPEILRRFKNHKVKARVIGEWQDFATNKNLQNLVEDIEEQTKDFNQHVFTVLFGYDGRREMLAAVSKLQQSGEEVTAENLKKSLWVGELPEVDLVIRTGGEPHWSAGFMMWHTANSQFVFDETLWPDFDKSKLKAAIAEYDRRERRLGK